ncbi:hypothetical protein ASE21_18445 [Flavobacterium sp. Root901]|uniref:FkbM family methyltransferase n=1 Tax=Flavobacterium sp. Root901 TaxID=1736605 RepID=UPI00070BA97C|nr:FkbM family methyltransferase [Flavobacterium sp. Root901]KRD07466.1 hypothetical protein ASE21_18445 [Flavobacterium sp. Root901]
MKEYLYRFLAKLGYKIENKNKERERKISYLKKYKVIDNLELLIKTFDFIRNLENKYSIRIKDNGQGVLFTFDDTTVYLETCEEFFILNEIFYSNDYNFCTNDEVVVIDIGANIGLGALFFSSKDNVKKIYSYEPVPLTYDQAKFNLTLNKNKVVELNNYGLGNTDKEETFLFNKNVKGNTGSRGALSSSFIISDVEKVNVIIKNASSVLKEIINQNQNFKIVLKVDCEGAEYEIFEDLDNSGILNKIDFAMIEWHDKGSQELEKILLKYNFNCFSQQLAINTGMIYAYRK